MAAKKLLKADNGKAQNGNCAEPKRLSKAGEWLRANPNGLGLVIHDMRAVMR